MALPTDIVGRLANVLPANDDVSSLGTFISLVSGQGQYADGMNLYLYGGANPVNMRNALGLFADDSWLDDFIDDYTGWRIGVIGTIQEGARWASLGMNVALEIAISLIPGYDAVKGLKPLSTVRGASGITSPPERR